MHTRVAHIRDSDSILGAERVVLELARTTTCFGVESTIVVPASPGRKKPDLYVAAKDHGIRALLLSSRGKFDPLAVHRLRHLIRAERIDVLHSHGYKEDLYALMARPGVPLVGTNHLWKRTSPKLRAYAWLDSRFLRGFDAVVAVSEPIMQDMARRGIPSERLHHIPNGIDSRPFALSNPAQRAHTRSALGLRDSDVVFGMVSSLTPEKGHAIALRAFARCAAQCKDAVLLIVGDGAERQRIAEQATALGIEGRVSMLGRRENVAQLLQGLDVLLLPSLAEGLPISMLEAMAAALPVIASSVGDVPQVIEDGVNGRLVTPGDDLQLAAALGELAADAATRRRLGQRAQKTVRSEYSAERMTARYCALYASVRGGPTAEVQAAG